MPGPGPTSEPALAWSFQAEAPIRSSAAVVAGTVFIAPADGSVLALDLASGSVRWRAALGAEVEFATPLVVEGLVIVGDRAGGVHALDAGTGATRWRAAVDGGVAGAAATLGEAVLVATRAGTAYALDRADGEIHWSTKLPGGVTRSIAASDDHAYFPVLGGRIVALRPHDGSVAWDVVLVPLQGEGDPGVAGDTGTPAVADGLVFVPVGLGSLDPGVRSLVALDARTGEERWRRTSPDGEELYAPAVHEGSAYIVGEDETVAAVDARTGALRWEVTTGAENDALPALWDRTLFVATTGGELQALDAHTGALLWSVEIVGVPYSATVSGGLVLVPTNAGVLYAFGDPSG
jgi:outer membrane protein assembly factor BamB